MATFTEGTGDFTVRLIGRQGIRITPGTELQLQQGVGAQSVEVLELLPP